MLGTAPASPTSLVPSISVRRLFDVSGAALAGAEVL
jgi:hypothetical protein